MSRASGRAGPAWRGSAARASARPAPPPVGTQPRQHIGLCVAPGTPPSGASPEPANRNTARAVTQGTVRPCRKACGPETVTGSTAAMALRRVGRRGDTKKSAPPGGDELLHPRKPQSVVPAPRPGADADGAHPAPGSGKRDGTGRLAFDRRRTQRVTCVSSQASHASRPLPTARRERMSEAWPSCPPPSSGRSAIALIGTARTCAPRGLRVTSAHGHATPVPRDDQAHRAALQHRLQLLLLP